MSKSARIRNKTLSLKIAQAPTSIQQLRAKIIKNAIRFSQEIAEHNFQEVSEIIRVCTALGVERAYLRGLQHSIASEGDIDKYIHRFDLLGALPFIDQDNFTVNPSRTFLTPTSNTILLFCLTNKFEQFYEITSNTVLFHDPVDLDKIQTEIVDNRILPITSCFAKYRESGADDDYTWLPEANCALIHNEFYSDCISTMDIAASATRPPELNAIVTVDSNPFPYMTPNQSFPFSRETFPEQKRFRMVFEGQLLETEDVIIANKFELSGTVEISSGLPVVVEIVPNAEGNNTTEITIIGVNATDTSGEIEYTTPDGTTETVPLGDAITTDGVDGQATDGQATDGQPSSTTDDDGVTTTSPETPTYTFTVPYRINSYYGDALYIVDPVSGKDTKFTEELFVDDIVELELNQRQIEGGFYLVGEDYLYYSGTDFVEVVDELNKASTFELKILFGSEHVTIKKDAGNINSSTKTSLTVGTKTISYNGKYKIENTSYVGNAALDVSVNFYPTANQIGRGTVVISGMNVKDSFVKNETFTLKNVKVLEDGAEVDKASVLCSFTGMSGTNLLGVYATDGSSITRGTSTTSLTKTAKTTPISEGAMTGVLEPSKAYFKVSAITDDENLTLDPAYTLTDTFRGKLYRIGFNIQSSEQSSAFNTDIVQQGVGQFLELGEYHNTETFYIPKPTTDKAILYDCNDAAGNQLTETPDTFITGYVDGISSISKSVEDALSSQSFNVLDYTSFSPDMGVEIPITDYITDTIYEDIDSIKRGVLYFSDTNEDVITIETLDNNNAPVSHGFAVGDTLKFWKHSNSPNVNDSPIGEMIDPDTETNLDVNDFDPCGLKIPVVDIIDTYRFTVDKIFSASTDFPKFLQSYQSSTATSYLTISNGIVLEYWMKYFKPVFLDGTCNANSAGFYSSLSSTERTLSFMQRGKSASYYFPNYDIDVSNFTYQYGLTPVEIEVDSNEIINIKTNASDANTSDQGLFLLSIYEDVSVPPDILESIPLRLPEFKIVTI